MILSGEGKLYRTGDEKAIGVVDYRLQVDTDEEGLPSRWSGDLILAETGGVRDGDRYILELDDKRRGRCSLKKMVNKAIMGMPTRYYYRVNGSGPLG